ncbi:YcnI family protein [Sinorhizobium meliloti]|uniref:YcnI family copper-binding membrane protein n=1 Tax=Rhizobium meliloti TaxID=382 RepID=UPI00398D689E
MLKKLVLTAALIAVGAGAAIAHTSLETKEAPVGASYKAVFRVPHGCDGKPTNAVRVQIPEGVIAVKPMPKPGWILEKVSGAYEKSYDNHGTPTKEGVKEVLWKGGHLGDDEYDEFVVRVYLTSDLPAGKVLYFPTVQECPDGAAERWIEIPAEGQSGDDLGFPAPGVKLLEKAGSH